MTRIEWADAVWNPTIGCSRISEGCERCYAITAAHRGLTPAHRGLTVHQDRTVDWTGQVRCLPERLTVPLRRRRPTRWFVDSMSDLFHPQVPDAFIARVFAVMAQAHRHTFLILTKRPQRMASLLGDNGDGSAVAALLEELWDPHEAEGLYRADWPLPNVWLATSIESDRYTWRADRLRATPAAVRWLSLEPLLEPLPSLHLTGIDWVVAGGESGPGARPAHPGWVRDIRDRCVDAAVPFFFKQWGAWTDQAPERGPERRVVWWDGTTHASSTLPPAGAEPTLMWRVGKHAVGRQLDGRTWDQLPAQPEAVRA